MSNSLATVHPELIVEWSDRNLPLTPDSITFGSNKKVWWKGACGHEWETSIKARSNGEKCPICSGARVIAGINDLNTLKPKLASEWSEKNEIKPTEVSIGSHKKVIWKCKLGHEWIATVKSRTINRTGCPYCSHNKVLAGFNDLATLFPEVADEWSDKNEKKPTEVMAFANSKAWWKCKTCGYEWNTLTDAINDAINAGKQISFQYYDYTGLKKKVLKNKGEVYRLSPYKLLWNGDNYYVLGYSEKKSKVINFRVDRIASKPEILDKDIIPMPDDFDIENYTKEVFFMFSGEKVLVDLRCDNSLMKTMVDRFGEDVTTLAYDMTSFRVQTEVSASPTFLGWVFGFNGKVQILAPESVKEQYRQMIAQADEDMQQKENEEQEI
ncbi:hypothetical protein JCM37172_10380 [Faecalimonas hominis]